MMLVDQRAAHVRVLYERNQTRLRHEQGHSQQLLFPHTVELSPSDAPLFDDLLPDLRALGFELERMSGRTVAVRGVPTDVQDGDESTILEEILEQYKSAEDTVDDERRDRLAARGDQEQAVADARRGGPDQGAAGVVDALERAGRRRPSGGPAMSLLTRPAGGPGRARGGCGSRDG
jgi:DNA mismatch repair protein MutL